MDVESRRLQTRRVISLGDFVVVIYDDLDGKKRAWFGEVTGLRDDYLIVQGPYLEVPVTRERAVLMA